MLGVSTFLLQTRRCKKLFAFLLGCARLVTSAKEVEEKGEEKMSSRTYEIIQGVLSYVVLMSLALAATFTIDYNNLLGANDLTAWAREFMPPFIITTWAIFAVAVVVKLWGAWVQYRFWYRIDLSNKLHALAERIDTRRK